MNHIARKLVALTLPACLLIAASLNTPAVQAAEAAPLDSFLVDAKTCSYGPQLDAAFDELQKKHDAEAIEAGFDLQTFDNMEEEEFRVFQPMSLRVGDLLITNIAINFDNRLVFFEQLYDQTLPGLQKLGVGFQIDGEPDTKNQHIADNVWLSRTGDAAYNPDIGRTEWAYDPLGKSRLVCWLARFERLANEAGKSVEEFAQTDLDAAIWDADAAKLHDQSEQARKAGNTKQAFAASTQLVDRLNWAQATETIEYALALDSHAENLVALGRQREARTLLVRALDLAKQALTAEHPQTITILGHYASVVNDLGDSAKAWPLMNRVLFRNHDILGADHPDTLAARDRLGAITADLIRRRDDQGTLSIDDARVYLTDALTGNIERLGVEHPQTITTMLNLGQVLVAEGRTQKALEIGEAAWFLARKVMGDSHPLTLTASVDLANTRLRMPDHAAEAFDPALLAVVEHDKRRSKLLTNPNDEAQRERETLAGRYVFERFADAAWSRSQSVPAERDRLRGLAVFALQEAISGTTDHAIALSAARKASEQVSEGLGQMAVERQALSDQWRQNEAEMTRALAEPGAPGGSERERLVAEQQAIEERIKSIDATLRKRAPEYFSFVRAEPLDAEKVRGLLKPDEAILMVVPTDFGTHVMAITADAVAWQRSDWTAEQVNAAVRRLLWDVGADIEVDQATSLRWSAEGEGAYPFDRTTAHRLYSKIVAPVAAQLAGKRHVFIAAGGSLSSLPFAMLVTDQPTGSDGDPANLRATKWFGDAHALIQIPSIQSLQFQRNARPSKRRGDGAGQFTGFGDPALEGQAVTRGGSGSARRGATGKTRASGIFRQDRTAGGAGIVDTKALKALARLPGTSTEIRALGQLFDAGASICFWANAPRRPICAMRSLLMSACWPLPPMVWWPGNWAASANRAWS